MSEFREKDSIRRFMRMIFDFPSHPLPYVVTEVKRGLRWKIVKPVVGELEVSSEPDSENYPTLARLH